MLVVATVQLSARSFLLDGYIYHGFASDWHSDGQSFEVLGDERFCARARWSETPIRFIAVSHAEGVAFTSQVSMDCLQVRY